MTVYAREDVKRVAALGTCKGHKAKPGQVFKIDCPIHEPVLKKSTNTFSDNELKIPLTPDQMKDIEIGERDGRIALAEFSKGILEQFRKPS